MFVSVQPKDTGVDLANVGAPWAARPTLNLVGLLQHLDDLDGVPDLATLEEWLAATNPTERELRPFVRFGHRTYRRNLVRRCTTYEALVLCWRPGQFSPLHDHHGSRCGVSVLTGEATEVRFDRDASGRLRAVSYQALCAGTVTALADDDLHVVANWATPGRSLVTLHVYTPPLRDMRIYPASAVTPVPATQVAQLEPPLPRRVAPPLHLAGCRGKGSP
jgi:cysteine dioxygenase